MPAIKYRCQNYSKDKCAYPSFACNHRKPHEFNSHECHLSGGKCACCKPIMTSRKRLSLQREIKSICESTDPHETSLSILHKAMNRIYALCNRRQNESL